MPQTRSSVTVDPSKIGTASVQITHPSGTNVSAYTSANGDTAVSWPDEITTITTYHLTTDGEYHVSVKVNDVEVADGNGGILRGGNGHMSIAPSLNTISEIAAAIVSQAPLTGAFGAVLPAASGGDDTAAIQAVLDAAATAGVTRVFGRPGTIYSLASPGTITVSNPSGGTSTPAYCLTIPSGVILDGRGCTFSLTEDAIAFINESPNATTDVDCGLVNAVIDGNDVSITETIVRLNGVTRPTLDNVRIIDGNHYGFVVFDADDGHFDRLTVDGFTGQPYHFGSPYAGKDVRHSAFGRMAAYNITKENDTTQPGNAFYGNLTDCTVDTIIGVSCDGGVKFQWSTDVAIGKVLLDGGGDTVGNSGFKFQGDATQACRRVAVDLLVVNGASGSGLMFDQYSEDCSVDTYIGTGNATGGLHPDVWLGGDRCGVRSISSTTTGAGGVLVRSTADYNQLGRVLVRNPGQVTTSSSSSSYGFSAQGGSCDIDSLSCLDDQGTKTMNRGIDINGAAAAIDIKRYKHLGSTIPMNGWASADCWVGLPRISTDALAGEISPTAAATSTTVANNNIVVPGTYVQPVIEIVPLNSAAMALGTTRVTFSAGNIVLRHASAAGGEKFGYRIVGYRKSTTQAA